MNQAKRIEAEMKHSARAAEQLRSIGKRASSVVDGKNWAALTTEEKSVLSAFSSRMMELAEARKGTR